MKRYRALRVMKYFYMVIGLIFLAFGLIPSASIILEFLFHPTRGLPNFSNTFPVLLAGISIFAIGELIDLLVTLAQDIHYMADYFRKITKARTPKSE